MSVYEENFCRAVDTIIAERLKELTFDKTINCTIIELADKENGKYYVTDGSSKFYAYVNDDKASYRKNTSVQVLIPEGNFNNKKLIIGKTTEDDESSWQLAVNQFLSVSTEKLNLGVQPEEIGFKVNNSIVSDQLIGSMEVSIPAEVSALVFSAEFRTDFFETLLSTDEIVEGTYGLKACLKTENQDYWIEMTNFDIAGDSYKLGIYLTYSKIFDIIQIDKPIESIMIYFYQKNDFKQKINEIIEDYIPTEKNNIFIKNINFQFGYPKETYSSSGLEVYTTADSTYAEDQTEEELQKTLKAKWTKNFEDKLINIEDPNKLGSNELIWYESINDSEDWVEMSRSTLNNFSITVQLNINNHKQKYKAKIVNADEEEIESNIFEFSRSLSVKNNLKIKLLQKVKDEQSENGYRYVDVLNFINNTSMEPITEVVGSAEYDLFKILIELRGYDGKKKEIEENYTLNVESLFADYNWSGSDYVSNSIFINSSSSKININAEGVIESNEFKILKTFQKNKTHVFRFTLSTSTAQYEQVYSFGYKIWNYQQNNINCSAEDLSSNLNFSNNKIVYDNKGALNNYFNSELYLRNLQGELKLVDIEVYYPEEYTFTNALSIYDKKLSPPQKFIWGDNIALLVQFKQNGEILYTIPIIMEQEKYTLEQEADWVITHINDDGRANIFTANLGFGEKNKNGTFSGVYLGNLNKDQGLFSIENGRLNLGISTKGVLLGDNWRIASSYVRDDGSSYPLDIGGFIGRFPGGTANAFFLSERGVGAYIDGTLQSLQHFLFLRSKLGIYFKRGEWKNGAASWYPVNHARYNIPLSNGDVFYDSNIGYYRDGSNANSDILSFGAYFYGTTSSGSDKRLKNNIFSFDEKYENFYNQLQPCTFEYRDTPGKQSNGFIAQDVERALKQSGIDKNQNIISVMADGYYALTYQDFIPLNTWQIQKLKNRVNELELEVQELKTLIKEKMEHDIK